MGECLEYWCVCEEPGQELISLGPDPDGEVRADVFEAVMSLPGPPFIITIEKRTISFVDGKTWNLGRALQAITKADPDLGSEQKPMKLSAQVKSKRGPSPIEPSELDRRVDRRVTAWAVPAVKGSHPPTQTTGRDAMTLPSLWAAQTETMVTLEQLVQPHAACVPQLEQDKKPKEPKTGKTGKKGKKGEKGQEGKEDQPDNLGSTPTAGEVKKMQPALRKWMSKATGAREVKMTVGSKQRSTWTVTCGGHEYIWVETYDWSWLHALKPDFACFLLGHVGCPLHAISWIELQKVSLDNDHRGKMVKYSGLLLDACIGRPWVAGMLTDLRNMEIHKMTQQNRQCSETYSVDLTDKDKFWEQFKWFCRLSWQCKGFNLPTVSVPSLGTQPLTVSAYMGMVGVCQTWLVKLQSAQAMGTEAVLKVFDPNCGGEAIRQRAAYTVVEDRWPETMERTLPLILGWPMDNLQLLHQPARTYSLQAGSLTHCDMIKLLRGVVTLHGTGLVHGGICPEQVQWADAPLSCHARPTTFLLQAPPSNLLGLDIIHSEQGRQQATQLADELAVIPAGEAHVRFRDGGACMALGRKAVYAGNLYFASDDILEAAMRKNSTGQSQQAASSSTQPKTQQLEVTAMYQHDLVPFVKTCYLFSQPSAMKIYTDHISSSAPGGIQAILIKDMWDRLLSVNHPLAQHWKSLVELAHINTRLEDAASDNYSQVVKDLKEGMVQQLPPPY